MAARWQVFFPSWVPSGLISSPSMVAAIADDCDIFAYWYGKNISFLTSFTLFCQFKSWYSILWASQVVQLNLKRISLQCRRLGSIPRLGRSPGEGNGDPLQYSFFFFFYFWNAIIDRMEVYKWISKWNQCTQEGALTWDQLTMKTRSDGRRLKSKAEWGGKRKREEGPWDRVFKTCSADEFNFQVPEALVNGLGQTCYLVTKSSSRDRLYLEWGGRLEIWGDCRQSMTKRTEVWGCEH